MLSPIRVLLLHDGFTIEVSPDTQHMNGFITILYVNKMPVQINIFRWGWITMTEFFKGTALDIVLVLVKHICTWEPNQANILKWIKAKNISHHP